MQRTRTLPVAETRRCEGLLIVTGGLTVFFLPVEVARQIVLPAEVDTVAFQRFAIIHLGLLVTLLVVGAIAFA